MKKFNKKILAFLSFLILTTLSLPYFLFYGDSSIYVSNIQIAKELSTESVDDMHLENPWLNGNHRSGGEKLQCRVGLSEKYKIFQSLLGNQKSFSINTSFVREVLPSEVFALESKSYILFVSNESIRYIRGSKVYTIEYSKTPRAIHLIYGFFESCRKSS